MKEYILYLLGLWNPPKPGQVPHVRKRRIVRECARKHRIRAMVETGTYLGDMVAAMAGEFEEIYSIELFEPLYEKARLRFSRRDGIFLYFGDSGEELQKILATLERPAVFWLDAHYSGEGTAREEESTPILRELSLILTHRVPDHVILIDDASDFDGRYGYPDLDTIRTFISRKRSSYLFAVRENIIFLEPAPSMASLQGER
jgi:hypothetical protein